MPFLHVVPNRIKLVEDDVFQPAIAVVPRESGKPCGTGHPSKPSFLPRCVGPGQHFLDLKVLSPRTSNIKGAVGRASLTAFALGSSAFLDPFASPFVSLATELRQKELAVPSFTYVKPPRRLTPDVEEAAGDEADESQAKLFVPEIPAHGSRAREAVHVSRYREVLIRAEK